MKKLRQEFQELALNHPDSFPDPLAMRTAEKEALVSALALPSWGAAPTNSRFECEWEVILCRQPQASAASRGPVTLFPRPCPLMRIGLSHSPKHTLWWTRMVPSLHQPESHLLALFHPMHTHPWNALLPSFNLSNPYYSFRPGQSHPSTKPEKTPARTPLPCQKPGCPQCSPAQLDSPTQTFNSLKVVSVIHRFCCLRR